MTVAGRIGEAPGSNPLHSLPDSGARHFDIWLASRFRVSAGSSDEAALKAAEWLQRRLLPVPEVPHVLAASSATIRFPEVTGLGETAAQEVWDVRDVTHIRDVTDGSLVTPPAIEVVHAARFLHDALVLSLVLLSLEQRGGEAAARVEQLRREVMDQAAVAEQFRREPS